MKLSGLIVLCLILILAYHSEGQKWSINVTRKIDTSLGSTVTIPCSFTCPPKQCTGPVQVYWKKQEKSKFNTYDNDQNAFVSHTNESFVIEKYRGRTMPIGSKANGNCSLQIRNVNDNEPRIYVRVIGKTDNFSFWRDFVSISLPGAKPVTLNPDIRMTTYEPTTQGAKQSKTLTPMYIGIFVPIAALLIIISVMGIVFYIKRKRSQPFTREASGYFASFRGAKREAPGKNHDDKTFPQQKAIDEPVYANMEVPTSQMHQRMDNTDNIYGNVDYS